MPRTELIILLVFGVVLHFIFIWPFIGSGAIAGAIFCLNCAFVSIANKTWVAANWELTDGRVVDVSTGDPALSVFEYEINGLMLEGLVSRVYEIGETVDVYFDPSDPSRYLSFSRRVDSSDLILIAMGLVIIVWPELV